MKKIFFKEDEILPFARIRFEEMAGITQNRESNSAVMNIAESVRKKVMSDIEIKGNVLLTEKQKIEYEIMEVEDYMFSSPYFIRIPNEIIEGTFFYLFMIENRTEKKLNRLNSLESVFADLWGTAYIDAVVELLQKKLKRTFCGKFLSENFGPGYFGMPITDSKKYFDLLDGKTLGINLHENGILSPEKSCTGFFFITNKEIGRNASCKKCIGNRRNCNLCRVNGSRK